jgi:hypothetical protein
VLCLVTCAHAHHVLDRPLGFRKVEAPRFQDSWHMKVVKLSALHTGRLYPRNYSWYSFMLEAESPQGHSAAGRIMSMKNSFGIGNQFHNLPTCSTVPQPTAPLAACPHLKLCTYLFSTQQVANTVEPHVCFPIRLPIALCTL